MKTPYYLFSTSYLQRKQNTLHLQSCVDIDALYEKKEEQAGELLAENERVFSPKSYLPVQQVESLYCFGETAFSSPALRLLGREGIPVHFFDFYGKFYGSFYSRETEASAPVILQQAVHYTTPALRLKLVSAIVQASLRAMNRLLQEYDTNELPLTAQRVRIEEMQQEVQTATGIKRIGGAEGFARRCYYEGLRKILHPIPFASRIVRPPDSPVNALLSYGYALLYAQLCSELFRSGLSPVISYVHEPRERRFSLALDLADIFKPLVIDRLVLRLLKKGILNTQQHFEQREGGVYCTKEGTMLFTKQWEEYRKQTLYHPRYKRNVSLLTLLRLECLHLALYLKNKQPYQPCSLWSEE